MFARIARIIRNHLGDASIDEDYDLGWHDAVSAIAHALADCLKAEGLSFDRSVFLNACGFPVGHTRPVSPQRWKAVPYNDRTEISNPFAVATIIDGKGEIIADVFSREAAALIEKAPEIKQKLEDYERSAHG
jgi:hypothetical protein